MQATSHSANKPPAEPSPHPALDQEVRYVKGVGEKAAGLLARLGVYTVRDLLTHFPVRYQDRSQAVPLARVQPGKPVTVVATVSECHVRRARTGLALTQVAIHDGTGSASLLFFNQPFLQKRFQRLRGQEILVYGEVSADGWDRVFKAPEWEELALGEAEERLRVLPVYPLTDGLTQGTLRRILEGALARYAEEVADPIPPALLRQRHLVPASEALKTAHFPLTEALATIARRRIVYEELLTFQVGLAQRRAGEQSEPGRSFPHARERAEAFAVRLPFTLTGGQQRALAQILEDMEADRPMHRLLQGDVGSGKTAVAAAALAACVEHGVQGVLMAPTEILAEQQFRVLHRLLSPAGIEVAALTGSLPASEKARVYEGAASGKIGVVVGTHALIQEGLSFAALGLVVIDEQHRFGVEQRARLRDKGLRPDTLVMTATPIPRTLSLSVYGDLDVSIIDELPPGRKPIRTHWKPRSERERVYQGVRKLALEGRQSYVVCPLVEESEKKQAQAATELARELRERLLPDLRIGLLHGQMKPVEKDAAMEAFRRGSIQVLVSTTVIEVGVDVPNATVMVVEDAASFGLAQLHQLRGRVGRGEHNSFCVLIADPVSDEGRRRLEVLTETTDGFRIAEEDLRLRGPGEFYGTRQSGLPAFRMADIVRDVAILEEARDDARALVAADPRLERPEHQLLAREVARRLAGRAIVTAA